MSCNVLTTRTIAHRHLTGDIIGFIPAVETIVEGMDLEVDLSGYLPLSGGIMTGGLSSPSLSTGTLYVGASTINFFDLNGVVIENLRAQDVTDFKEHLNIPNSYLSLTGGTLSGNIDLNGYDINNVNAIYTNEIH